LKIKAAKFEKQIIRSNHFCWIVGRACDSGEEIPQEELMRLFEAARWLHLFNAQQWRALRPPRTSMADVLRFARRREQNLAKNAAS